MTEAIKGLASVARPTASAQKVIPRSKRLRKSHERPSATNHRCSPSFRDAPSKDTPPSDPLNLALPLNYQFTARKAAVSRWPPGSEPPKIAEGAIARAANGE